jgi:hypothetical protein
MTKMISSMVPIAMWSLSIQLVGYEAELNHLTHRLSTSTANPVDPAEATTLDQGDDGLLVNDDAAAIF